MSENLKIKPKHADQHGPKLFDPFEIRLNDKPDSMAHRIYSTDMAAPTQLRSE